MSKKRLIQNFVSLFKFLFKKWWKAVFPWIATVSGGLIAIDWQPNNNQVNCFMDIFFVILLLTLMMVIVLSIVLTYYSFK